MRYGIIDAGDVGTRIARVVKAFNSLFGTYMDGKVDGGRRPERQAFREARRRALPVRWRSLAVILSASEGSPGLRAGEILRPSASE